MAIARHLSLLLAAASVLAPTPFALAAAIGDVNQDNDAFDCTLTLFEAPTLFHFLKCVQGWCSL